MESQSSEKIPKNTPQTVTENLTSTAEFPGTYKIFEANCFGLKNNAQQLSFYVKKIPEDHLVELYKQKSFPIEYFLMILASIKVSGLNENLESCAKFFQAITRTFKFELLVKQLIRKERKDIKVIFEKIEKSCPAEVEPLLYEKYNCNDPLI